MEIQSADGVVDDHQDKVQDVTIQEFSHLVQSQPRKWLAGIHRVPQHLRTNKHVYEPEIISLGPYHHGKPELNEAEGLKYFCLDWFAEGDENKKVQLYNKFLKKIDGIRACYAEVAITGNYDDKRLALMMLLDACFIVNLMKNCTGMRNNNSSDWLGCQGMAASVRIMIRDVFVLENQIPFGALHTLMSSISADELVKKFLGWTMKVEPPPARTGQYTDPPIHILEACWRATTETCFTPSRESVLNCKWWRHISPVGHVRSWWRRFLTRERTTLEIYASYTSCRSVTDLKSKGIRFKPSHSPSFVDIAFKSRAFYGELQLPVRYVSPQMQVMLANLIAYEVSPNSRVMPITLAYVIFMKSLIESPADVKELQRRGILINSFSNPQQVVKVFSEIDTFGYGDLDFFAEVKRRIEAHCGSRARTWIADLIHTRFRSPWTAIAMLAAAFLLCLTFLQTYFTIHPVKQS